MTLQPNQMIGLIVAALVIGIFASLLWFIFWNKRWIRVKAIIAIALTSIGVPSFTVLAKWLGLEVTVGGFGWPVATIALLAIGALAWLEYKAAHESVFETSATALGEYLALLARNASAKEKLKLSDELRRRPDVDKAVFQMIQRIELLYADRSVAPTTPKPSAKSKP